MNSWQHEQSLAVQGVLDAWNSERFDSLLMQMLNRWHTNVSGLDADVADDVEFVEVTDKFESGSTIIAEVQTTFHEVTPTGCCDITHRGGSQSQTVRVLLAATTPHTVRVEAEGPSWRDRDGDYN